MHKWWARRLGSVFRTILLYSLSDDNFEEWDQNPRTLWDHYARDVDFSNKIVFDPMMGGGTTVIEALRFGCKVIAGDINPVSWFVVKKQVEDIDPDLLRECLVKLENELGPELRKYYRTHCPECEGEAEAIYYFYYKELECHECGDNVPLMKSFVLAKSLTGMGNVVVCPSCWDVFETKESKKSTACPSCETEFIPEYTSTVSRQEFSCISKNCRPSKIIEVIREQGRPKECMYAIEFYCEQCDSDKNPRLKRGRGYKAADSFDRELLRKANHEFNQIQGDLPIPQTGIPEGVETQRALNHGYEKFRDMFNSRQLLNLGKIHRWIIEQKDWKVKEFLILAFSNSLKYNNLFAKYNATRGFITDIFRTHSFSPSMAPVEANCYDTSKGRGAFTAFVNLVIEGKEYCRNPFERVDGENGMVKIDCGSSLTSEVVETYAEFNTSKSVFLNCGSSETIPIPNKSVDIVVTDPPYYGNVMYSELSNFFYVWLRMSLRHRYTHFKDEFVPNKLEIIENRVQKKGKREFLQGLTQVFRESTRVLKDRGLFVFTFHHKKVDAWAALLQAILNSELVVSAIHPVRSEMKASTHLYDMNNITMDMVIVCKKRLENPKTASWHSLKKSIRSATVDMVDRQRTQEGSLNSLDGFMMALGKCLELYSKHYPNVMDNERKISVEEALDSIQSLVDDVIGS